MHTYIYMLRNISAAATEAIKTETTIKQYNNVGRRFSTTTPPPSPFNKRLTRISRVLYTHNIYYYYYYNVCAAMLL